MSISHGKANTTFPRINFGYRQVHDEEELTNGRVFPDKVKGSTWQKRWELGTGKSPK